MPHECQWPISETEACGLPAHNCIESEDDSELRLLHGEPLMWLCAKHFDWMANLIKNVAQWDDPVGELMARIVRKNRL